MSEVKYLRERQNQIVLAALRFFQRELEEGRSVNAAGDLLEWFGSAMPEASEVSALVENIDAGLSFQLTSRRPLRPVPVIGPLAEPAVGAEVWSDDHMVRADFAANAWLAVASGEDILGLIHEGLSNSSSSDMVADYHGGFDEGVCQVFDHVSVAQFNMKHPIGYACSVSAEGLRDWLAVHRPSLLQEVMETFPHFPEDF